MPLEISLRVISSSGTGTPGLSLARHERKGSVSSKYPQWHSLIRFDVMLVDHTVTGVQYSQTHTVVWVASEKRS